MDAGESRVGAEATQRLHNLAEGQVVEFLVWSRLIASSGGDLHVFLPLDDRGVDGIVHRISTEAYAPVQVKGHAVHPAHGIVLQVPEGELLDDRGVVVGVDVELSTCTIGDHALVVDIPAFRDLAHRNVTAAGEVLYEAQTLVPPRAGSPWARWCVPVAEMGERLLPAGGAPAVTLPRDWREARGLGHRAEMELLRRAADAPEVNVFKAFPDLEPNEYLVYNTTTREIAGIQVKSVTFADGATEAQVSVYRPALRPSPQTWFVVFLAREADDDFLPDCVVLPSTTLDGYLAGHGVHGRLWVTREVTGRLAPWRVARAELGARLARLSPP